MRDPDSVTSVYSFPLNARKEKPAYSPFVLSSCPSPRNLDIPILLYHGGLDEEVNEWVFEEDIFEVMIDESMTEQDEKTHRFALLEVLEDIDFYPNDQYGHGVLTLMLIQDSENYRDSDIVYKVDNQVVSGESFTFRYPFQESLIFDKDVFVKVTYPFSYISIQITAQSTFTDSNGESILERNLQSDSIYNPYLHYDHKSGGFISKYPISGHIRIAYLVDALQLFVRYGLGEGYLSTSELRYMKRSWFGRGLSTIDIPDVFVEVTNTATKNTKKSF
jgi:hypothetical protein